MDGRSRRGLAAATALFNLVCEGRHPETMFSVAENLLFIRSLQPCLCVSCFGRILFAETGGKFTHARSKYCAGRVK